MDGVKQCKCGEIEFWVDVDDNVVRFHCFKCEEIYLHDEFPELENYGG